MKIAVVGPPGTGKSSFARELVKQGKWEVVAGVDVDKPFIIDNYVQRIQKKTGLALGPWSSYVENYMVAGERMKQEAMNATLPTLTVGTILDSLMYAHMHADLMLHQPGAEVSPAYIQAQTAIQALAMWYTETWDYNLAFFLPFPARSHGMNWERQYAALLPEVIETYMVPGIVTIPEGSPKERAKLATEVIELARAEEERNGSTATPLPPSDQR